MKQLQLGLAKIIGTFSPKGWTYIHTYLPDSADQLSKRGQLLAVIGLSSAGDEEEMAGLGKELVSRIHEEYYGELVEPVRLRLKTVLEKVQNELGAEANLQIAVAALVGSTLNVAILGAGRLVLCRKGQVATILTGSEADQLPVSASGILKDDDLFILGSTDFFRVIERSVLEKALTGKHSDEVAEELTPLVHRSDAGVLAVAVVGKAKAVNLSPTTSGRPFWVRWQESLGRIRTEVVSAGDTIAVPRAEKQKKTLVTVALVLLALLLLSVALGRQQRSALTLEKQVATVLTEARQKKEEGDSLVELNPGKAKELLLAAKELIGGLKVDNSNQAVNQFRSELDQSLALVVRERVVEPELFFDLELIKKGAKISLATTNGESLAIVDKDQKAIYRLDLENRKSAIIGGGPMAQDAIQMAAWNQAVFVLTGNNIIRLEEGQKDQVVIRDVGGLTDVIGMQSFEGNLYLLTKETIWQFPLTETGYGGRKNWLKDSSVDLGQADSLAIDGSVWVLAAADRVIKLSGGSASPFQPVGLISPLSGLTSVYTNADQQMLYLLDSVGNQVVALKKTGEYAALYQWSEKLPVSQLVVSEKLGRIFLLGESKIYAINIK